MSLEIYFPVLSVPQRLTISHLVNHFCDTWSLQKPFQLTFGVKPCQCWWYLSNFLMLLIFPSLYITLFLFYDFSAMYFLTNRMCHGLHDFSISLYNLPTSIMALKVSVFQEISLLKFSSYLFLPLSMLSGITYK